LISLAADTDLGAPDIILCLFTLVAEHQILDGVCCMINFGVASSDPPRRRNGQRGARSPDNRQSRSSRWSKSIPVGSQSDPAIDKGLHGGHW
jgi:hypothetical protein